MRITKEQIICGLPALEVQAFAKHVNVYSFNEGHVQDFFKMSPERALAFMEQFFVEGYAVTAQSLGYQVSPPEAKLYNLSPRGGALAGATTRAPVSKAEAQTSLDGFLARLHNVNTSDWFLYRVSVAVLFGSMLSDSPDVGDVDIALSYQLRTPFGSEERGDWHNWRLQVAFFAGRRIENQIEADTWPCEEVKRYLQGGDPLLSLVHINDLEDLPDVKYRRLCGDAKWLAKHVHYGIAQPDGPDLERNLEPIILSCRPGEEERRRDAKSPDTDIPRQLEIAQSKSSMARWLLAGNPHASEDALRVLAADKHIYVRAAVAGNSKAPVDALHQLMSDPADTIRVYVAGNPTLDPACLETLFLDPAPIVRVSVVNHPRVPSYMVNALLDDPNIEVRCLLAATARLTLPMANKLKTDHHNVRVSLASNSSCPSEALEELAEDADEDMQESIRQNMSY